MSRIALVTRLTPSSETAWVGHLRRALPGETIDNFHELSPEQRAEVDIAIAANPDPADLLELPGLIWVQSLWAGVERLVAELGTFPRPIVRLVDPELARTMAEAALAWSYYLFRDMPAYGAQQRRREWTQRPYRKPEQTCIGVLGLGELGTRATNRLREAGFRVVGWSRRQKDIEGVDCYSADDGLKEMLSRCNILICLLPLTEQTRNLLDAGTLAALPEGAQIINFARGAIINDAALLAALDSGHIRHAVLDVFSVEPLPSESPYWGHEAVTVLPHISATTDPATAALIVAENILAFRREGILPPAVNLVSGY